MSAPWKQIEALYAAARDLSPAERAAFLARECGDETVRLQVETLLGQGAAPAAETLGDHTLLSNVVPVAAQPNMVGPYRMEERLGAGGMGEVYRATDTRLGRAVALKLLHPDQVANPMLKRRFLQEARSASALNHPNIVILYDIAHDRGTDFLVMEYVGGRTLRDLIAAGPLAFSDVAAWGSQIALALGAAHGAGIVHRDIKPANVMVTAQGQVKVLDFGIAKLTGSGADDGLTQAGAVIGTVSYMSPEQTRGEEVDGRSDIFSLGCLLHQAATGRLPFTAQSALATMHEIATVDPPPPSTLREGLPRAFDVVVARCLEKDPERRPQSALEVATELKALTIPEPEPPRVQSSRTSIAVLPFQMRSSGEDQFLSVSLADAIIYRLSSTGKMIVRPITSVMRYAGKAADPSQVAREVNVDIVIGGVIQALGPKIRVMVQAHRAHDQQSVHSLKVDGEMSDLFALQDRVADGVADHFAPKAESTALEPGAPPTRNAHAFELYSRASVRALHLDKLEMGSAIETLTRVTQLDPRFAAAWGLLAQCYATMGAHLDRDPKWFTLGEQAVAKALELDPLQCDALCARGQIVWSPSRGFQNHAALRALSAALRMNPHRTAARGTRGAVLWHMGFVEDAEVDMREALAVSPSFTPAVVSMGYLALHRGDLDCAIHWGESAIQAEPTSVLARMFAALPYLWAGRMADARRRNDQARQFYPDEPYIQATEALIAAHEGNFKLAEELADAAVQDRQSLNHTHHSWHFAAGAYSLCGKPEKAIAQLDRCCEVGFPDGRLFLADPHLRPLHGHPGFQALLTRLRQEHDDMREEFGLTEPTL